MQEAFRLVMLHVSFSDSRASPDWIWADSPKASCSCLLCQGHRTQLSCSLGRLQASCTGPSEATGVS